MEVVEQCSELLANRQVLDMIKDYKTKKQTNLATILYETSSYLQSSPASSSSLNDVSDFLNQVKEHQYELTKMEKIQIVNLKPKNETELTIVVDNIDDKLDEAKRADLLQLIQAHLEKPAAQQQQHRQQHPSKRQRAH